MAIAMLIQTGQIKTEWISGFSISTFSTVILFTQAINFAKLEIVTGFLLTLIFFGYLKYTRKVL